MAQRNEPRQVPAQTKWKQTKGCDGKSGGCRRDTADQRSQYHGPDSTHGVLRSFGNVQASRHSYHVPIERHTRCPTQNPGIPSLGLHRCTLTPSCFVLDGSSKGAATSGMIMGMAAESDPSTTIVVEDCLQDLRRGVPEAREQLIELTRNRLQRLTQTMLKDHVPLGRWEELDDVLQRASLRLWMVLKEHHPESSLEFFRLAATVLRRELIDIARHYYGPLGQARHHQTPPPGVASHASLTDLANADSTCDPGLLQEWSEFHTFVESLPEAMRSAFDLLWYQGLRQSEAAQLLGVSERTVQRRWHEARMAVYRHLHGKAAGAQR